MDLATQLRNRRKSLRPSKTLLTNHLGERFEVDGGEARKISDGLAFVVDDRPDLQVAAVAPGLFLSSQDPLSCPELLQAHRIRHVLSLGVEPGARFPGISYHFVEILDLPEFDLLPALERCLRVLRSCSGHNVLVHCNAGVSRSPSAVIFYLMREQSLSYDAALDAVRRVRPGVRPNDGFARQLRQLEVHRCN